jgi:hypothetical protein
VGVGVGVAVGLGVGAGAGVGGTGEKVVVRTGCSGVRVIPGPATGSVDVAGLEVGPDVVGVGCRRAVVGDAAGMRGTGTMVWPTATAGTGLPAAAGNVPVSGVVVGSSVGA